MFIDLVHVSNKESHKTAADQRHCRGRDHHDDAPSLVDQEAQATSDQDLSQLHHAGEDSTIQALPSPIAVQAPSWGLLSLQGKCRNTLTLHEPSFRAAIGMGGPRNIAAAGDIGAIVRIPRFPFPLLCVMMGWFLSIPEPPFPNQITEGNGTCSAALRGCRAST